MESIILIGGGGHCRSVIDVIEQENRFKIAGIIEKPGHLDNLVLNYKVIGDDNNLQQLSKQYQYALITVGQIKSPELRIKLFNMVKEAGFILPVIISPRSYVSKHAKIQEGSVIMHDALINAGVNIGKNCIINSKALIEHDAKIEDHCHISTQATINGGTIVQKCSFVGSGATIIEGVKTNKYAFIKAGSLSKGYEFK